MIGFIVTAETATAVLAGIEEAQRGRGLDHYWTTGAFEIFTGGNVGKRFIPANDALLSTPLRDGLTPQDFPEFDQLLAILGGLDARVEIDSADLINPDQEEL
jgi:hypothetical protein